MIVWAQVAQKLVDLLPTLPGWADVEVFDGPPVTASQPTTYASVGFVDEEEAGSWETSTGTTFDGHQTEAGEVRCQVVGQNGDNDLAAARTQAFALVAALDSAIAADQTLGGVLSPDATCALSVRVESTQNSAGAAQRVVVALVYSSTRR